MTNTICTISIVNYKQKNLLIRCLDKLFSNPIPSDWEIIVVDNDSHDGSTDFIKDNYPTIKLFSEKQNHGFGGGHNIAYRNSDSDFFVVLNPDILVFENSIEKLIEVLHKNPNAAIAGPCLLNPDGSMQFSARRFYNWKTVIARRLPWPGKNKIEVNHLMKDFIFTNNTNVDWMLGAAYVVRRNAFKKDYLFDPRYRLYFEDVDLCYFAHQDGWNVIYCPDIKMIHDHQRQSAQGLINKKAFIHMESWVKFWLKTKKKSGIKR